MEYMEYNQIFSLEGRVAVITGGGSGIGRLMAKALEKGGARKVYILGRRKDKLESVAKEANYGNIAPIQCDVTSKSDLQSAVDHITSEIGYVNLIVANAGIQGPEIFQLPRKSSIKEVRDFLFKPPWPTIMPVLKPILPPSSTHAFLELLDAGNQQGGLEQGWTSQVIGVSSNAAFVNDPSSGFGYSAAKAGLNQLFKQLAHYLAPYEIRSNVLAPGFYRSELTNKFIEMGLVDNNGKTQISGICAMDRIGRDEEMVGTIIYLASRAGAYCTGSVLLTDGGRTIS